MKTVNIALIWDLSFEGALMTTGQHICVSSIKEEKNYLGRDRVSSKDTLVPFEMIYLKVLVSNTLFVFLVFNIFSNMFNDALWLFILSL